MKQELTEDQIRKQLSRYIAGKISLQAFRDWLVPATWDVDKWPAASLRNLVYEIKLRLAEYTSGHWSEMDLREKLSPLIVAHTVTA